jgi:hypothetical protein
MKPLYYDRQGNPIDGALEWAKRMKDEKRVAETTLADGTWVSTVWLGLDHSWGGGPPLIFETMVRLPDGTWDECERYSTEAEALAGHGAMVERWRAKLAADPAQPECKTGPLSNP